MFKQKGFLFNNKLLKEINNIIKKGKSIFENCFIYKDLIKFQQNINDIFKMNFTDFFNINNLIYQGIIDLTADDNDFPYYLRSIHTLTIIPNYNILKDFKSEYIHTTRAN